MSNQVTKTSPFGSNVGLTGNLAAMGQALANSGQVGAVGLAPDGSEYMNFSGKRGVYEFGREKTDVQPDELWLVNIESFQQGWSCWKKGNPIAVRLASVYGNPVAEPDPEEHGPFNTNNGEGWFLTKALVVRSLDEDRQGYFKINSKSGVAVIAVLQQETGERMLNGLPCWPVVSFDKEKFLAQGNWNYKPVVTVQAWLTTEQVMAISADPGLIDAVLNGTYVAPGGATPAIEPEPAADPIPEPEPEPEPEPVADPVPSPSQRRRRTL